MQSKQDMESQKLISDKSGEEGIKVSKESVRRNLQSRHLEMIAIGGAIGTGLFVGSGKVLLYGGPLGAVLSYLLTGFIVYFVMTSLGEVSTCFPVSGSFASHASRFVDPALGFAVGWNYYLIYTLTLPAELIACANILQYWWPHIPKWAVILSVLAIVLTINLCGVAWFGEVEFVLSLIKVTALVLFIIFAVIIIFKDNVGLENYRNGPLFGPDGASGFFQILTTTFFAYSGTELVSVSAGEAQDPKKSVPNAIKTTFWRITFFYTVTIFLISLLVAQDNPQLTRQDLLSSPFVIAIQMAKITSAADIINGVIFVAVLSAANSCMYATSRTLQGLALSGHAPAFFKQTSVNGVPVRQVLVSALFACLGFLSEIRGGNRTLEVLLSVVGMQVMITYLIICLLHIRFRKAMAFQGYPIESLAYAAPYFPYGPYFVIGSLVLMVFGMSIGPIIWSKPSSITQFASAYGGLLLYFFTYLGYKLWYKTKMVLLDECDLVTDRYF